MSPPSPPAAAHVGARTPTEPYMHTPHCPAHAESTSSADQPLDVVPLPVPRSRPAELRRQLAGAGILLPGPDAAVHRAPANDNNIDADKVAMLRAAITRGRFRFNARLVAERIVSTW